jgi:hypothetical protein
MSGLHTEPEIPMTHGGGYPKRESRKAQQNKKQKRKTRNKTTVKTPASHQQGASRDH